MCSTAYLFLLASSIKYANADTTTLTVSCSARAADSCEALAAGADPSGPYASGSYSNGVLDASGFWTFDVEGSVGSQAEGSVEALTLAAFSSGVVEGALSCNEIEQFSHNVLVSDFGHGPNAGPNAELLQFIEDNDAWVRGMVDANAAEDDYWLAVGQLMAQMDGILVGLHSNFSSCSASSSNLTRLDLLLVNLDGDLFDLQSAYPGSSSTSTSISTRLRPQRGFAMASSQQELRCSALFKILDDRSDVFFGHSTWDTYATAAPRIFKNVRVPVRRGGETLQHVDSFSSSPGFIASIDDYYVLDGTSALAVIETSFGVRNQSAYDYLTPQSVLCWLRTMASNMLATDAKSWTDLFAKYHSGTYNNQWMVVDPAKFPLSSDASDSDLFWVLEEAPGLIHAEDQTAALLADGYWGSYNVAFYDDIRERIGETSSYESCPRANLFREMQGNVSDLETMSWIMGWNDYENDPLSLGNPGNAIMARDDLEGYAGGGIDAKCSSILTVRGASASASAPAAPLMSLARAGPTHDPLPAFCWEDQPGGGIATPHEGHPDCFNYSWTPIQPLPSKHQEE